LLVVAEAFEVASGAAEAEAALLHFDLAGAEEVEVGAVAGLFEGRIDADLLGLAVGLDGLRGGPALG
jgi:hypothetical protein